MAGPIARRPSGLLDLLLTQQQGKNPSTLGDDLLPVLDLREFYESQRIETVGGSLSTTAVNQSSTITVPSGQVWRPLFHAVSGVFATANQEIAIGFEIGALPGAWQPTTDAHRFVAQGATDRFGNSANYSGCGIIVPSGTKFVIRVHEIDLDAQANIPLNIQLAYVRMES